MSQLCKGGLGAHTRSAAATVVLEHQMWRCRALIQSRVIEMRLAAAVHGNLCHEVCESLNHLHVTTDYLHSGCAVMNANNLDLRL